MEAGAALPPARVPGQARAAAPRPPFARAAPPAPPGPAPDHRLIHDHRLVNQDYRAGPQEHRQLNHERRAAGPAPPRDCWRRRRERPPPAAPHDGDDYSCMVHVEGFPGYTRPGELVQAFVACGAARVLRLAGGAAALAFPAPAQAAAARAAPPCLYGQPLTVRPYTKALERQRHTRNRVDVDKGRPKAPTVDPGTISWEGDFHAQLGAVLTAVRLSQDEIKQLASLYQDLEAALKTAWPGCLTIPFGSLTTGLGVKASDADCFVLLPGAAPRAQAVPRARRVLAQRPHLFSALVAIPNANTPIVKFYHLPTSTHCDVSFKTLLGVQNSKLIHFLLSADPRLLPLAVLVKYWAAVHELSGTGKLTNYALTMLIIFYLQQPPRPILPPIAWLQRDRATDYIVDGWNTGFMSDRGRLPPTANTDSLADLIGGFFRFYAQFTFSELVVCPYLGYALPRDSFRDLNLLPAEFERYKTNVAAGVVLPMRHNTNLCVQDPFEQCHNVASPVTSRLACDIRSFFNFAAESYARDRANDCKTFLQTILLGRPTVMPRFKTKTEFRVSVYANSLVNITAPHWQSVAKEVVQTIFDTILKVKLEPTARRAPEPAADCPPKNREKIKYSAVITRAIWKRKQFSKLYSAMKLKFVERETKITEEIMTTDNNVINVPFHLVVTLINSPRTVILSLRPNAGDQQNFKELSKFFQGVMAHWFIVLSRPYCDSQGRKPTPAAAGHVKPQPGEPKNMQRIDDFSDSDTTDSDASTEDERVPPDAQTESNEQDTNEAQNYRETSTNDTNKENIEEINNVDSNKNASTVKTESPKTRKDKTNDSIKNPRVDKCGRTQSGEKSVKGPDSASAVENGKVP